MLIIANSQQVARREYYTQLGETLFTSQKVVKRFFENLVVSKGEIVLQHKGEARVSVVTADSVYDRFVRVHEVVDHYGERVKIPTTINYSEVMNFDVKLTTSEGVMKRVELV